MARDKILLKYYTESMRNIPELLSDWEDLDSEMRLRRFAAGTQPSLLLRRFFTNLHQWKHTGAFLSLCIYV